MHMRVYIELECGTDHYFLREKLRCKDEYILHNNNYKRLEKITLEIFEDIINSIRIMVNEVLGVK